LKGPWGVGTKRGSRPVKKKESTKGKGTRKIRRGHEPEVREGGERRGILENKRHSKKPQNQGREFYLSLGVLSRKGLLEGQNSNCIGWDSWWEGG